MRFSDTTFSVNVKYLQNLKRHGKIFIPKIVLLEMLNNFCLKYVCGILISKTVTDERRNLPTVCNFFYKTLLVDVKYLENLKRYETSLYNKNCTARDD